MNSELNDFIFYSKYSKYNNSLNRKESFEESVQRVFNMHWEHLETNYNNVTKDSWFVSKFNEIEEAAKSGLIFGSQRALQFGGNKILEKNAKLYNCSYSHCDRPSFFKELLWILLCGCGVGCSVHPEHVNKLPILNNPYENGNIELHIIDDSIEGWAIAIDLLVNSYFYPGCNSITFDYSKIRPKGSLISGGFIAPGPDGLRNAIENIRKIMDNSIGRKLKPIECFSINCHLADSVLSGGVRRCISKGSKVLVKNGTYKLIEEIEVGDYVKTLNGYSKVLNHFYQGKQDTIVINHQFGKLTCTENHKIAVLQNNKIIWKNASDLNNDDLLLFSLIKEEGEFENKLPKFNYVKPLHSTTCKDIIIPELTEEIAYLIGVIQGDGYIRLTSKLGVVDIAVEGNNPKKVEFLKLQLEKFGVNVSILNPTPDDNSFRLRVKSKQLATYFYEYVKQPKTELKIPKFILNASNNIKEAFISGIFCADGSFKTKPACVCSSIYENYLKELQALLYNLGIPTYIKNRTYPSRKAHWKDIYSLNITGLQHCNNFKRILKFTPKAYDREFINNVSNVEKIIDNIQPVKIINILKGEVCETFDIEVENDHSFMCEGILVHNSACSTMFDLNDEEMIKSKTGNWFISNPHYARSNNSVTLLRDSTSFETFSEIFESTKQFGEPGFAFVNDLDSGYNPCFEIAFKDLSIDGKTGWLFCNLTTISGKDITNEETFYKACELSSILGTIQASYNKFPFLGKTTEQLVARDSLLGCSISGIMMHPEILLNPEILRKGANIIKETNKKVSKLLGINPAKRTTCIKPDGNFSSMTGNTPGCHAAHSKRYIRRVQVNKDEESAKIYQINNPNSVTESVWSNNKVDNVISFPIELPDGTIFKKDLTALEHLNYVKLLQENWIKEGNNNPSDKIDHNVSVTVLVDDHEWEEVKKYIWENKYYFSGISLLAKSGDLIYNQAAYSEVLLPQELINTYGNGIIFASGLIVDIIDIFGDVWKACDVVKGIGESIYTTDKDVDNFLIERNIILPSNYMDMPYNEVLSLKENCKTSLKSLLVTLGYPEKLSEYLINFEDFNIFKDEIKKYLDTQLFDKVDYLAAKRDIVRRIHKFSKKYFNNNIDLTLNALKHVQLYHDWCALTSNQKQIDWTKVTWQNVKNVEIDTLGAVACSGGACEITKV